MGRIKKVCSIIAIVMLFMIVGISCNENKDGVNGMADQGAVQNNVHDQNDTKDIEEDSNLDQSNNIDVNDDQIQTEISEDDKLQENDIITGQQDVETDGGKEKEESKGLNLNIKKLEKVELAQKEEIRNMRDITALELVSEIKIGWNLGNTLDANGSNNLKSETSWGNPSTSKEMINLVKEAGFNVIRIPTTWENHLGVAPDYTIDPAWMNRVKEVVNYAIDNEMYVILNLHHEEWHFPSNENYDKAKEMLTKIWAQIADYFDYYDEYLIFEGMNEPRMKGTSYEWTGGTPESREVVSKLNLDFIETIRKSGGNNNKRHLMIPTYAASSDPKTWKDLVIPEDDKIIVSLHAYTPYNFALNGQGTDQWSIELPNDTREIDSLMMNIDREFTSKEIPVILGEFGARNKDNLESRVNWAKYYVMKAKEIGVPCIWWDNGAFEGTGENFGLMNRRDLVWKYPEIVKALMDGVK